jgi:hypothetical protein
VWHSIKNPYDDLNTFGHTFTTICGWLLCAYLVTFAMRHATVVGAWPGVIDSLRGLVGLD